MKSNHHPCNGSSTSEPLLKVSPPQLPGFNFGGSSSDEGEDNDPHPTAVKRPPYSSRSLLRVPLEGLDLAIGDRRIDSVL